MKTRFTRPFQICLASLRFTAVGASALLLLLQAFFTSHAGPPLLMLVIGQSVLGMIVTLCPQILLGFSLLLMQFTDERTIHGVCLLEV
jgi:hypothetical protein